MLKEKHGIGLEKLDSSNSPVVLSQTKYWRTSKSPHRSEEGEVKGDGNFYIRPVATKDCLC